MAYKKAQKPLPEGISCHSTRAVSTSRAAFRGVSKVNICAAATGISLYFCLLLQVKHCYPSCSQISSSSGLIH